jgi:hypothetical protein
VSDLKTNFYYVLWGQPGDLKTTSALCCFCVVVKTKAAGTRGSEHVHEEAADEKCLCGFPFSGRNVPNLADVIRQRMSGHADSLS